MLDGQHNRLRMSELSVEQNVGEPTGPSDPLFLSSNTGCYFMIAVIFADFLQFT